MSHTTNTNLLQHGLLKIRIEFGRYCKEVQSEISTKNLKDKLIFQVGRVSQLRKISLYLLQVSSGLEYNDLNPKW